MSSTSSSSSTSTGVRSVGADLDEKKWLVQREATRKVNIHGFGSVAQLLLEGKYPAVLNLVDIKLKKGYYDCRNALFMSVTLTRAHLSPPPHTVSVF